MMNYSFLGICLCFLPIGLGNVKFSGSFDDLNCPGVNKNRNNIHLQCFNRSEIATDCSFGMPPGSTANYSCPKYFKSTNPNKPNGGLIHCRQGEWKSYSEFIRFACVPVCGQWNQKESLIKLPPWNVQIYNSVLRRVTGKCQGTLIPSPIGNASTVLSSRSCISKVGGNNKNGSHFSAIVGQSPMKYQIDEILYPESEREDLAILHLSQPVDLSENVLPVCILPVANSPDDAFTDLQLNSTNKQGLDGLIFGMERTSNTNTWVNLTALGSESCCKFGFRPSRDEFCALKKDSDASMCSDIFQPFLIQISQTFYLYGVPKGTLQVNSCPQQGVVYTNVSSHGTWIQETLLKLHGTQPEHKNPF